MMAERYENETVAEMINRRLDYAKEKLTGTLVGMLDMKLVACSETEGTFDYLAKTEPWMINFHGTLHGGMCAMLVDQAMGHTAFCLKDGPGIIPNIDMNVKFHRPMVAEDEVLLRVRLVSRSKSLMHLSCEAFRASAPEKLCVSATATYFHKPDGKHL